MRRSRWWYRVFVRERLPLSALRSFESGPRGDGCDGKLCARAWYPRAEAYGETWTRGYRGIKPDEVPQRNLLREKFYAEVQPFAERMKKKDATVRERTEALYALAVQNQMQENSRSGGSSLNSRARRHLQKNTVRFMASSWSCWTRSSRCWVRRR